ncbi:MAG: hypothetical protein ACOYOB_17775, partial [Myxococcota bacterium]
MNVFGHYRELAARTDEANGRGDGPARETNLARAVAVLWRRLAFEHCLVPHLRVIGVPEPALAALASGGELSVDTEKSPEVGTRQVWLMVVAGAEYRDDWTHGQRVVPRTPRPDLVISSDKALLVIEFKTD